MAWLKQKEDLKITNMKQHIERMIKENLELVKNTKSDKKVYESLYIKEFEKEAETLGRALEYIKFLEREKYENDIILMTADNRKYRKKYLAEERKKNPQLLYPDADEIYMKYFMQRHIIQLMAQEIYLLDREVPYSGKNGNIYAWTGTDEIINYFTSQIEKIFEVKK